jgi:hypothetical protein
VKAMTAKLRKERREDCLLCDRELPKGENYRSLALLKIPPRSDRGRGIQYADTS